MEYEFVGHCPERDPVICEHRILVRSGRIYSRGSADARSNRSKGHRPSGFILAVARKTFQRSTRALSVLRILGINIDRDFDCAWGSFGRPPDPTVFVSLLGWRKSEAHTTRARGSSQALEHHKSAAVAVSYPETKQHYLRSPLSIRSLHRSCARSWAEQISLSTSARDPPCHEGRHARGAPCP